MDRKWLPLTAVLGVATAVVLAATLWPEREEKTRPPETLCFGSLSRATAALIDDGKGGDVTADELERPGQGDRAVFKICSMVRADAGGGPGRRVYSLTVQDASGPPGLPKGAVPLGAGFVGWALPERAEAALPVDCARSMGSTAPYVVVDLDAPTQSEERGLVDRDTALRNSAAVVREAATNLARTAGC
ncbi:hypothetical protein [Streptomyces sp. bgisy060]|uniref:hypothetical protein n=1 Tax=Streptomyces sp. bgisy060 TaxID=3413775 RepID=UPI003EB976DB